MTDTLKVLGQADLAATTSTDVYTVPGATSATISTIAVCNRTSGGLSFRVNVSVAGAADSNQQYLYYDLPIAAFDTFTATIGVTLAATDVVRAYASGTGLSINIFGVEVT